VTVTVFFVEMLVMVKVDSVLVTVFVLSVVVLIDITVTVEGAIVPCEQTPELDVSFADELDERLLDLDDETNVDEVEDLEIEALVLVGLVVLENLVDEDETLVTFELELLRILDVLDFEDESGAEELVGLLEVLDVLDLDVERDDEELWALLDELDELEEVGFEEVLVVLVFPLDVVEALEDVELVGLALDVLDVTVVEVHSPVTEGTALAPEPIGIMFVPQLAA
jgi:hypothetical protein